MCPELELFLLSGALVILVVLLILVDIYLLANLELVPPAPGFNQSRKARYSRFVSPKVATGRHRPVR